MGQVIVITGLAQGMGRDVACRLAAAGHSIAGFDLDAVELDALEKELDALGAPHHLVPLDITDRKAYTQHYIEKFGYEAFKRLEAKFDYSYPVSYAY